MNSVGEPPTRAHSEGRSWVGPGAAQQQHHQLPQKQQSAEHKQQQQQSGYKSPESESVSLGSFGATNGHKEQDLLADRSSPQPTIAKDEVGYRLPEPQVRVYFGAK